MSGKKKLWLVLVTGGYLFCLYAGITERFSQLNLYSEGGWQGEGTGYLWELLGMFCWLGMLPAIPDSYYLKDSRIRTFLLILPILVLTLISLVKSLSG